ncbi:uncharacterized protein LOC113240225 [Hyposmocoma kahamanoa]|nr:uncharacterized protein LOC113240225 [Hyposmocoma kahamanoa]
MSRERIKIFLKKIVEGGREFAVWEIDLKSVKVARRYCIMLIVTLTIGLVSTTIEGIVVYIKEGIPIRTEVVLYPSPQDTGIVINILRTLVEIHWWLLIQLMTAVDCLVATSLVFVGYKFRTLEAYFGSLRQKYLQRSGENLDVLERDFRKDFITGIKFHKEILW